MAMERISRILFLSFEGLGLEDVQMQVEWHSGKKLEIQCHGILFKL